MKDDLEDYPLAKAYGWTAPKYDTGGILYLYPPIKERVHAARNKKRRPFKTLHRERVNALNPYELHLAAFDRALDKIK